MMAVKDISTLKPMHFNKKLLVFPTSRSIREYLKNIKDTNTLLPTFLTIDEFLIKVLSFSNRKYVDEEERFLYLKEASNIKEFEKLGFSNEFSFFFNQSQFLFRFFGEIASEHVKIEDIYDYDTYEFYKEHTTILKTIYDNYLNILDYNKVVDKINLDNHYIINDAFLNRFDEIGLFYEGYFTKQEFHIIQDIFKKKNLFIQLYSNEYNQKSLENLKQLGFNFNLNHKYIVNLTQNKILQEEVIIPKKQNVNISAFNARTNQVAFVKKSIVEMIKKGIDTSKIAVVVPDESFTTILSLYDTEHYFNYAMGLNIYDKKAFQFSLAINDYLNDDEKISTDVLNLYNIKKNEIDEKFKPYWYKKVSQELFNNWCDYIKLQEKNDDLIEKINDIVFKLSRLFFENEQTLSFKEAIKIFNQKLSSITLDDVNSGTITVMGVLESRAVQFDGLIIVDFNENFVPRRSIKDKFLSTNIKRHIGLPTSNDRENLQKYYYQRLISNAKDVAISYVKNENAQISRFATELFDSRLILNDIKDDQYKYILYNSHKLKHYEEDIRLDIDLSKQIWSATSLKTYLTCKRKYYLQYISKVKEHMVSLKPQGFELGDLIHRTLQKVYENYSLDEISYELLLKELTIQKIENPYLIFDLEVWKKRLQSFMDIEKERIKNGLQILACEEAFLIDYKGVKLKGVIDRIDKIAEELVILDYKTSSSLKVDTIKNYEKSKDFQLEFYYLACKEMYQSSYMKTFYYDLYDSSLKEEMALELKLELLDGILNSLNTNTVNFDKCDEKANCLYCPYSVICNR